MRYGSPLYVHPSLEQKRNCAPGLAVHTGNLIRGQPCHARSTSRVTAKLVLLLSLSPALAPPWKVSGSRVHATDSSTSSILRVLDRRYASRALGARANAPWSVAKSRLGFTIRRGIARRREPHHKFRVIRSLQPRVHKSPTDSQQRSVPRRRSTRNRTP